MVRFLADKNPDEMLYGGRQISPEHDYIQGGAGHVFSRATLLAMQDDIEECVSRVGVDGEWYAPCQLYSHWRKRFVFGAFEC